MIRILSILLCLVITHVSSSHAENLSSLRDTEIKRLLRCPEKPAVAVFGSGKSRWVDTLLHVPEFRNQYLVIEGTQSVDGEHCSRAVIDGALSVPPEHFSMYLVNVDQELKSESELSIHLTAIRTDSGVEIFKSEATVKPQDVGPALLAMVPSFVKSLKRNAYTCRNKFSAIVTEDIQLRCQGVAPGLQSQYKISSDFRLIFNIKSLNFDGTASEQYCSGSAEILPSKARTDFYLEVMKTDKQCTRRTVSHRQISINLEGRSVTAIFHVVIPEDVFSIWKFMPKLTSADPLFDGDAEMKNLLKSSSEGSCKAPDTEQFDTQYFEHKEYNVFKFATQELRPLCNAVTYVQPVFVKPPSLGTPEGSDITAGCRSSSAKVHVALTRRFYDRQSEH